MSGWYTNWRGELDRCTGILGRDNSTAEAAIRERLFNLRFISIQEYHHATSLDYFEN